MALANFDRIQDVINTIGTIIGDPIRIVIFYMTPCLPQQVKDSIAGYSAIHPRRNFLAEVPQFCSNKPNYLVLLRDTGEIMFDGRIIDSIWRYEYSITLTHIFGLGCQDIDDMLFDPLSDLDRRQNNGFMCRFEEDFDVVI
jgi:hypothetical protein